MNKKLVNEFSKKLKLLDSGLEFEVLIDKDNSALFGNSVKLCGEYLEAFFDGDQYEH